MQNIQGIVSRSLEQGDL